MKTPYMKFDQNLLYRYIVWYHCSVHQKLRNGLCYRSQFLYKTHRHIHQLDCDLRYEYHWIHLVHLQSMRQCHEENIYHHQLYFRNQDADLENMLLSLPGKYFEVKDGTIKLVGQIIKWRLSQVHVEFLFGGHIWADADKLLFENLNFCTDVIIQNLLKVIKKQFREMIQNLDRFLGFFLFDHGYVYLLKIKYSKILDFPISGWSAWFIIVCIIWTNL